MTDDTDRPISTYEMNPADFQKFLFKRDDSYYMNIEKEVTYSKRDMPPSSSSSSGRSTPKPLEKDIPIPNGNIFARILRGFSFYVALISVALLCLILHSFISRPQDKSCETATVWPSYARFLDFDNRYTRFADRYTLYLYRERSVYGNDKPTGVPVLFIPGNAGSYKQVRAFAAQAANVFADAVAEDPEGTLNSGKRELDFFAVDFNEDFSAFHGQTLLNQAEYVNDAITYILSLYQSTRKTSDYPNDESLPLPTSVMILGHSMGGIIGQAAFSLKNYAEGSINTLITLAAPHAMAPLPFDRQMVEFYEAIKAYWLNSFLLPAEENSLRDTLLVSVAGGGLDTNIVPEYSAVTAFAPPSNTLSVFTSGIPFVWAEIDHQAMAWCESFRRVLIRGLFAIVDARQPTGTVSLAERKELLSHTYIQGSSLDNDLTQISDPVSSHNKLECGNTVVYNNEPGKPFMLDQFGTSTIRQHVYPIPTVPDNIEYFELLTSYPIDTVNSKVKVLACRLDPKTGTSLPELNKSESGEPLPIVCELLRDAITLIPASRIDTDTPYSGKVFYTFKLSKEQLNEYHLILVTDDLMEPNDHFLVGGFANKSSDPLVIKKSQSQLFKRGIDFSFDTSNSLSNKFQFLGIQSSLLAYKIKLSYELHDGKELQTTFTPMLKQSLESPYETKFYVNVTETDISLHGISPFMEYFGKESEKSLVMEFIANPFVYKKLHVTLLPDYYGSAGRLLMRYRTLLGSFPVVIVAFAAYCQFRYFHYGSTFLNMNTALEIIVRRGLVKLLVFVSILSIVTSYSTSRVSTALPDGADPDSSWRDSAAMVLNSFWKQNHLLFGLQSPQFWVLAPILTFMFVGLVVTCTFIFSVFIHILSYFYGFYLKLRKSSIKGIAQAFFMYMKLIYVFLKKRDNSVLKSADLSKFDTSEAVLNAIYANPSLAYTYGRKDFQTRLISNTILLFIVMTVVPFQIAYVILLATQSVTTAKSLFLARACTRSSHHQEKLWSFFNFSLMVTFLMLLLAPIDFPVLLVWARNISTHWYIPFPTHHNFFSIIPFMIMTEILRKGKLPPRLSDAEFYSNNLLLFFLAFYSLIYGAEKPYLIHNVVGAYFFWLIFLYAKNQFVKQSNRS
ncbi:GPI inositol deacylase [Schizosaccharomyces cryophilus OY26]|uniref:GPI inositol-deacylase n=1 Tax=Schizosaccharomyces cryophilus (strain OY26 / ATCC MYA-4695 / CBS 11777 / NBRC 106824 / NRRL Y48691) TaxID=653667 RepID=S9VU30_SCHCR|nr:GPI inositol deacylase [Schizosaccharomyces cryophilus OY26]EPY49694.1 GPI inositol deacylase [Schizosaccharomyces cryophilus OY26]